MIQDTHTLTHTDESGGSIHTSHALINHTHTLINQWACTSSELFIHKCSHEHLHVHIHVHLHKQYTYAAAMRHQPYAVCMYLYKEGIHIRHTYICVHVCMYIRTRTYVYLHPQRYTYTAALRHQRTQPHAAIDPQHAPAKDTRMRGAGPPATAASAAAHGEWEGAPLSWRRPPTPQAHAHQIPSARCPAPWARHVGSTPCRPPPPAFFRAGP